MRLEMRGIVKSFGANDVLRSVDFVLNEGEVCALLGENGAGKSTLMNILGGVIPCDKGEILLDGKPVVFHRPAQSLAAGIAFIHQELNLVNDLPVYENLFLGRELKTRLGFLDRQAMRRAAREVFDTMGLPLDPDASVASLDAAYKQIVEIARALMMNASVIIMDEPTSSLTDAEIARVFRMIRTLKARKVGVVFISHKLKEVMEICDRYVVLRDGRVVGSGLVAGTTPAELAESMVGHAVGKETMEQGMAPGPELLRLEGLTKEPFYRDISLSVHGGEVLGVIGLLGDGRSEIFRTVFGDMGRYQGRILIEGRPVVLRSTRQAYRLGIGYVPGNRKENGIIKDLNILENATIVQWRSLARLGLIRKRKQLAVFDQQRKSLRIRMTSPYHPIGSLSGGNQQKVVLAKWLGARPKVLILDNPTQGVDVGAKEEIYEIIRRLAREGMAVVVLSNEAQEIIRVGSRAIVLYHGGIQGERAGREMTEKELMRLATGG